MLSGYEARDLAQAYVSVLLKTLAQITVGSLMQFEITCKGFSAMLAENLIFY